MQELSFKNLSHMQLKDKGINLLKRQIIPGKGLDCLIFGSYPEEVIELLGLPDCDSLDEEGDRIFAYSSQGIKIASFDKSENFRLTSLEIDRSHNILLWTNNIFSCSIAKVRKIFNQKELELSYHQVCKEVQLSCNKLAMDFYFEDNILESISFGVFMDSNDKIIWPQN